MTAGRADSDSETGAEEKRVLSNFENEMQSPSTLRYGSSQPF